MGLFKRKFGRAAAADAVGKRSINYISVDLAANLHEFGESQLGELVGSLDMADWLDLTPLGRMSLLAEVRLYKAFCMLHAIGLPKHGYSGSTANLIAEATLREIASKGILAPAEAQKAMDDSMARQEVSAVVILGDRDFSMHVLLHRYTEYQAVLEQVSTGKLEPGQAIMQLVMRVVDHAEGVALLPPLLLSLGEMFNDIHEHTEEVIRLAKRI